MLEKRALKSKDVPLKDQADKTTDLLREDCFSSCLGEVVRVLERAPSLPSERRSGIDAIRSSLLYADKWLVPVPIPIHIGEQLVDDLAGNCARQEDVSIRDPIAKQFAFVRGNYALLYFLREQLVSVPPIGPQSTKTAGETWRQGTCLVFFRSLHRSITNRPRVT